MGEPLERAAGIKPAGDWVRTRDDVDGGGDACAGENSSERGLNCMGGDATSTCLLCTGEELPWACRSTFGGSCPKGRRRAGEEVQPGDEPRFTRNGDMPTRVSLMGDLASMRADSRSALLK